MKNIVPERIINQICNKYQGIQLLIELNRVLDIYNNTKFQKEIDEYIKDYDYELDEIMKEIN